MPVMNVRSSFSSLTARLLRYASDVNPAPKSSMETPTPSSRKLPIPGWQPVEVIDDRGLGDLDHQR